MAVFVWGALMIKIKPVTKTVTKPEPVTIITKTTMAALRLAIARKPGNDKSSGTAKSTPPIIVTKKRGRPVTGKAMTPAQRQAKFKALKKALA